MLKKSNPKNPLTKEVFDILFIKNCVKFLRLLIEYSRNMKKKNLLQNRIHLFVQNLQRRPTEMMQKSAKT